MMTTVLSEMLLFRTFIEPLGENHSHNNPYNHYEAMGRFLLLMTSNTTISEML